MKWRYNTEKVLKDALENGFGFDNSNNDPEFVEMKEPSNTEESEGNEEFTLTLPKMMSIEWSKKNIFFLENLVTRPILS